MTAMDDLPVPEFALPGSPRLSSAELRERIYEYARAAIQQERMRADIADAARVIAWANESPRRPANTAFTAGAERQAAYWIEWAEERCARICESRYMGDNTREGMEARACAAAIRGEQNG